MFESYEQEYMEKRYIKAIHYYWTTNDHSPKVKDII